jgi:hypothetical protein
MRSEPCLCGALDCVACRGPSARFANWCDGCEYEEGEDGEGCKASPGDGDCQRKDDEDRAIEDAYEAREERRRERRWAGED